MIEIERVGVELGDQRVLDGVDLTVDRGELVGLVGPNGAGKTTLLRTVNGLLEPADGAVTVDGERIDGLGAKAVGRLVATVPQGAQLGFSFPVESIVEMGRTPHRSRLDWSEATDAVDDALARTAVDHLRERAIDEVSGGERQRVLLARALAQDAPVLVLDEPTASLDVNHQVRVMELVRGLVDEGRTALAAIHDLDLAARYCDRLALLADGEVRRTGDPASVLEPDAIQDAFGSAAAVTGNPVTGTPSVTAITDRPTRNRRVHVVGTGPSTARALAACWRAGFAVSAGPVPQGDALAALAADLDAPVVTAPAFEPLDPAVHRAVEDLVARADVVLRAPGDRDATLPDSLVPVEGLVELDDDATAGRLSEAIDDGDAVTPESPSEPPASSVVDAVVAELSDDSAADD